MKGFFRYFCFYCASRLMYETARELARNHARQSATACNRHGAGIVLTIVSLPFLAVLALIVIGSLDK